jgi:acetate kinase
MGSLNVLALNSGSSSPAALALIGFAHVHFPGVPQVACFDTLVLASQEDEQIARHAWTLLA